MKKFNWYMISTISGKENVVLESLRNRIVAEQVEEDFDTNAVEETGAFKIFMKPTLTPKEAEKKRRGETYKIKYVNMYPGYVFIKMDMTDKAWFVIRNTQYVTGLIGSSGRGAKPTPVTNREIKKSLIKEKEALEAFMSGKYLVDYKAGDLVEVIDGVYQGEKGIIIDVDKQNYKNVTIEIESFGKKVPLTLDIKMIKSSEE
ncbi:transcription termination/antitermination protein NusG [Mycoplasmopsis ciconiae]|uniref:Transcription termination/antitermination protein NusG n=1 Tax=Mycoplasmopsis ciconiae TaxID=561067 RepID=A0ABU7MM62_9BACT|nr:transcription termination/antitermination protein NusG [Mycoplasmopsis ciconiae]